MDDFDRKIKESGEQITFGETSTWVLLNDPDYVWYIAEDKVNLFFVSVEQDAPIGSRMPLFTLEPTMLAFGSVSSRPKETVSLLATGNPDTKLIRIRFEKFKEMISQAELSDIACEKLDSWHKAITSCAFRQLPPKESREFGAGKDISLEDNMFFRPARSVLWCEITEGTGLLLGNREQGKLESGATFAFSDNTWMRIRGAVKLNAFSTREFGGKDVFKKSFVETYEILLDFLTLQRNRSLTLERDRLQAKRLADESFTARALHDVALALLPESKAIIFEEGGSHLLTACKIVGRHLGISFKSPPDSANDVPETTSPFEELSRIARTARIKIRKVLLSESWWTQDCGPLLAFKAEDGSPVALIPASSIRYQMFDPTNKTRQKVDRKLAHSLGLDAYTFYRPLPQHKLSLIDILKFGLKGTRKGLIAALIMGLFGGLLTLIMPIATGFIFNSVIPNAETDLLAQISVILVTCAIGIMIFDITVSLALLRVEGKSKSALEAALWDRLMSFPASFFRGYTAGDLAMRNMGISIIYQLISVSTLKTVIASTFSLLNLFLLFHYAPKLAWVSIVITLLTIIIFIPAPLFILRCEKKISRLEGKITGMVLQFITGISKLRLTGSEDRAFGVWAKEFSDKKILTKKSRITQNFLNTLFSIVPIVTLMLLFWITAYSIMDKEGMPIGNFMAFLSASTNLMGAIMQMLTASLLVIKVVPFYNRLKPILETTPENDETKPSPGILDGFIDVNHVSFRYSTEGPLILDDVSFTAKPGEFIAIVGSSGSGKSTLLRLLLGFDFPASGSIYYDGKDISKVDILELRRQMGVVLQDGQILEASIIENITGSSGLSIKEAWEAAEMAGCKKDIEEMPMKMHTYVTAGGGTLSGGQRQRILIARAIIRKPRIIFFDEATSSLDNVTQAIVSRSLEALRATRVVIAHRLSTIINADRIFVLEKGSILESGTYEELMKLEGLFAKLAQRQIA
ncbi:MAG: NHLP bacteriocin export ABC transporter permease/ATPase subunit [Desulfobacteraceae bacterium]|nr:NHLP bacteriocin export ABC transporter permease/ATPase subunit [Desulfobacteraceae bacterium]